MERLTMNQKIVVIIGIVIAALAVVACSKIYNNYTPDNPVEELVEDIIEAKTGLDLDLSPSSPE